MDRDGGILAACRATDSSARTAGGEGVCAQARWRTQAEVAAADFRGDRVRAAHRMSVEGLAEGTLGAPVRSTCTFNNGHRGGFVALWRLGLAEYDEMEGIAWDWQSVDGAMAKLRWRWSAWGRTPRIGEKNGRKRGLLVDGRGVPLSLVASGANVHDVKLLAAVLDHVVGARPTPCKHRSKHLCADAGYRSGTRPANGGETAPYRPHMQATPEVTRSGATPGYKARRWVVEASHGWFTRFRKLLVRYEKLHRSYLALTHLAAAIIAFRKIDGPQNIIYG